MRTKGRNNSKPTEFFFIKTILQQIINKRSFLFDTYSDVFAYYITYMLDSFYFRLMQDNLFHVAIVKYSTWA